MTSFPKPEKRVRAPKPLRRGGRPRKARKTTLAAAKRKLWDLFAAYVKERDGPTCISCGATGLEGSNCHAGHFYNAGAYGIIRYHPLNVHVQCGRCNVFLRGNIAAYASRFIELYGVDQLMYLNEIKRHQKQWRLPEILQLIAALECGGADYELLYAELIGHVFVPSHVSSISKSDAAETVDTGRNIDADNTTTCENDLGTAVVIPPVDCTNEKGDGRNDA